MKLLLIRHAECGHNVDTADVTDPRLSKNGRIQVGQLARHFQDRDLRFTRVFSSDLDRASETAEGICQVLEEDLTPVQVPELREQSLGSLGGKRSLDISRSESTPTYTEDESMTSMRSRVNTFLQEHFMPLFDTQTEYETVAIVAHGIILQVLWVCLSDLFDSEDVYLAPSLNQADFGDYVRPVWSNTGVMEMNIQPQSPAQNVRVAVRPSSDLLGNASPVPPSAQATGYAPLSGWSLVVLSVDNTIHLDEQGLGLMLDNARIHSMPSNKLRTSIIN